MVKATVLCRSAYSLIRVCMDIASVLGASYVLGRYDPLKVKGPVIIVANPDGGFNRIVKAHRHNRQIWYLTVEGLVNNRDLRELAKRLNPTIIANSVYTASRLDMLGLKIDGIIHHGTRYYPPDRVPDKDIKYLYVAGYLRRKYPPASRDVIRHVGREAVFVTTRNNPYLKYMDKDKVYYSIYDSFKDPSRTVTDDLLVDLYSRAMFYLNLSDVEGFGLTVLEAMSFGAVPIVENIPPFTEYCPKDLCVFYPWSGRVEYESFGENLIEHHVYNSEDVIEAIERAVWSMDKARSIMEYAKKYYIGVMYSVFSEYL